MKYKMLPIEDLKMLLEDMRWHNVADASGLTYPSVAKVAGGDFSVSNNTIKKLSKYFIDRHISLDGEDEGDYWKVD